MGLNMQPRSSWWGGEKRTSDAEKAHGFPHGSAGCGGTARHQAAPRGLCQSIRMTSWICGGLDGLRAWKQHFMFNTEPLATG